MNIDILQGLKYSYLFYMFNYQIQNCHTPGVMCCRQGYSVDAEDGML